MDSQPQSAFLVQLAVVHYVAGLGPAKDEGEESHSAQHPGSFQDQASWQTPLFILV